MDVLLTLVLTRITESALRPEQLALLEVLGGGSWLSWGYAGGIWLEFDGKDYDSFDASHLTEEASIKFSMQLSDSLKIILDRD